ncbi:adenylate/guanylate cyclase domain-containing protein [archaeon]|nr:adenylate/guanylate cyclase domain-containing protein [archaeon]MBT6698003.1 adenylate/guanylate cyclase domain-containing protein [archaeon]
MAKSLKLASRAKKSPSASKKALNQAKSNPKSQLATVMFVDIVGYSKKSSQLSPEEFSLFHDAFDTISTAIFEKYSGDIIKKMGDAYITTFSSATDAITCAVELQYKFKEYSRNKKNKIHIRIALNTGDIMHRKGDIYGDAVNATARIESITKATDIMVSESTFRTSSANTVPFRFIGARKLKGMKYPIKLFQVKKPYETILGVENQDSTKFRLKRILRNTIIDGAIILLIIACLFALVGLVWYLL